MATCPAAFATNKKENRRKVASAHSLAHNA
jgi:hypothetical protein